MKTMREFKISEYITLKLEDDTTIIYIDGKVFNQCKYLLFNIHSENSYDEIESIDEASEKLDRSMEAKRNLIPAETEFWGHCSNLQAWFKHDYDTRLLHRSIAFPLLKELAQVGDSIAKRVLKKEIVERFTSGKISIITYLINQHYLSYFNRDEIDALLDELDFTIFTKQEPKKAIPFLKNLAKTGNIRAKNIFKKEVKEKYEQGHMSYITDLVDERYLYQLDIEEINGLFEEFDFKKLIFEEKTYFIPLINNFNKFFSSFTNEELGRFNYPVLELKKEIDTYLRKNFKIVLLGDAAVGKTSILLKYLPKAFSKSYKPTIGINIEKIKVEVDKKTIVTTIWDLCGSGSPKFMLKPILNGVNGCILVHDITRGHTLENIPYWITEIRKNATNFDQISFIVVGNKIDLEEEDYAIDKKKIEDVLRTHNIKTHLFTSAKTGQNIKETFITLIRDVIKKKI